MNIKDFLIDNYIYILVVILLIIITIIGFLADKNKNKGTKKKNVLQEQPMPNNANMQPINYQANPQQMAGSMNYQGMNQMMPNNINNMTGQPINFGQIPNSSVTPVNNQFNQNLNLESQNVSVSEFSIPNVNNINTK